ncbi:hypothetical protein QTG56_23495 (plasmid) [Rossellomorea sp. AcN35-11]|nr:hypothetical protein [Rossellomorea aquimaris]WJV32329.1 hypothetical protein QTG56_23495 [Rossellomorea sp. AcN35-11]
MLGKTEVTINADHVLNYITSKDEEIETLKSALKIACKHTTDKNTKKFLTLVLEENNYNAIPQKVEEVMN